MNDLPREAPVEIGANDVLKRGLAEEIGYRVAYDLIDWPCVHFRIDPIDGPVDVVPIDDREPIGRVLNSPLAYS